MKRVSALIVSLFLCFLIVSCSSGESASQKYEGSGWETPEEAVRSYLDGFKNADLKKMISSFAIETYVDSYNFEAQLDRTKVFTLSMEIRFPNANDFFKSINVETRKEKIVTSICFQFSSYYFPEYNVGLNLLFDGENSVDFEEFIDRYNSSTLIPASSFEFTNFLEPSEIAEHYASERNQENINQLARIYGADTMKSMVASFKIAGKPYILCCDVLRYGEKWYLSSLGGNIGALLSVPIYNGGLAAEP